MMRSPLSVLFVAFLTLLAGKVAALNINITKPVGLIPASGFVDIPFARTNCDSNCTSTTGGTSALSLIQKCTDDKCLCDNVTVKAVVDCQQCMFNRLIHTFKNPDDPREGQTSALAAYSAACNSSTGQPLDKNLIALAPPSDWDGPFGQALSPATTALGVIVAALMGAGLIAVVSTM